MKFDIGKFIPEAIHRDLKRMIDGFTSKGVDPKNILIQIPHEDYGTTLLAVSNHLFMPYTPTLFGCPVASWGGDHVGVMVFDRRNTAPTLFTADGREHPVI